MTVKKTKRHCRGSKSKAKKEWEKRERASRPRARHEPMDKNKKKEKKRPEPEYDDCVICYDRVPVISNNIQRCKKATHILCAHCKLILLNDNRTCPLCRRDHIKRPVVRWQIDYEPSYINIYKHG